MYARYISRNLMGQSAEAELLIEVRVRRVITVMRGLDSFRDVVGFNVRRIIWLDKAAIHLGCKGHGVFFSMEGVLHISVDYNNAMWLGHIKLQISIVQDCIKAGESSSSEKCVITTAKGDDVEDQFFTLEVVWGAEYYLQC